MRSATWIGCIGAILVLLTMTGRLWAAASSCRYTVSTDNVLDNVTGLRWQRATSGGMNLEQATSYCRNLALGGYSSGWRLPTLPELLSLRDVAATAPYPMIDRTAFPDTTSYGYISSTTYVPDPSQVYSVNFGDGTTARISLGTLEDVRCVRR